MAERNRGAPTGPHVPATEVIVGKKLSVERTSARSTVIRTKTRGHAACATAFGSGRAWIFIVNHGIAGTERDTAPAARVREAERWRPRAQLSVRLGYRGREDVVEVVAVDVEVWSPT